MNEDDVPTGTATSVDPSADPALDDTVVSPGGGDLALTPGARIGRYELQDVLGKGGMGVVFRARDPQLDRPLAIKIVLPMTSGKRTQQRLLDEAKAMAKLRHPAVVPVFDVGTTDRGVYIVMPLVSGGTMHDWVQAERRTWRQVLDRYLVAGRGLAAAHDAGLVHRDFKPKNVLVSEKGEVLVADFGIAANADGPITPGAPTPDAQVSSIAGTPAYMAPEQAQGAVVDARADQFSFCISLWEGMHGQRPAQAETGTQGTLVSSGVPTVPADRRDAPGWLLAAIARGFSPSPERRWPSMAALLDHIERRLRRPRQFALAGGALFLSGIAMVAVLAPWSSPEDPCPDPGSRLARIWNGNVRDALDAAFARAAPSIGSDVAARVRGQLDRYAADWRSAQIETCEATHVRHAQSPDLLDRRLVCLDRRLAALTVLATTFTSDPNRDVVIGATEAAGSLPAIADCRDTERLLAVQPLPGSPTRRAEIAAVEAKLDSAETLRLRGNYAGQLEVARSGLSEARSLGYAPLLVRALRAYGNAEFVNGHPNDATARELAKVAAEAHDDDAVAMAWITTINSLTSHQTKLAEAAALEPVAEAAVTRAGSTPMLRFQLLMSIGARAMRAQDLDTAGARFDEARDIAPDDARRAEALQFQAKVALLRNEPTAEALANQALAASEQAVGPNHPDTAQTLDFMSQGSVMRGDFAQAEVQAARAAAIFEAVYGADHSTLSMPLQVLGWVANRTGRLEEARRLGERSVAILEQAQDPMRLGTALQNLGDVVGQLDGIDGARPLFERGLGIFEKTVGREHPSFVRAEDSWSSQLVAAGRCTEATPHIEHALAFYEAEQRPDQLPRALFHRARCLQQAGRSPDAIASLERANELCAIHSCEPTVGTSARAMLGELLVKRRDRTRGIKLLREARADFAARDMKVNVDEVDAAAKKLGVKL